MRLALVLAALAASPAVADGRTIVGEWATTRKDCGTQFAYKVGPRSLVSDELSCAFDGVSRSGDTVTFKGRCSDGESSMPETVVATRTGDALAVRFSGSGGDLALVACPAGKPPQRRGESP